MQLTDPQPLGRRTGSKPRHDLGTRAQGLLSGALLMVLGAIIAAVVGVLAGVVSPGQLLAPSTGAAAALSSGPPPGDASDAAAPAVATPPAAAPPRVLRDEAYGDWRFVCLEGKDGAAPTCSASQQLRVAATGNAVFLWRIAQDGHGGLVGIWQVPEAVLLSAGLTLDAGTPKPIAIPFDTCGGGSCQAVANLAPDFIANLSAARTLSASVVLANRETLKFPLSPKGLVDALAALSP